MRVLAPGHAPDLFDRIQVRRVRRKPDKRDLFPDIRVFGPFLVFDEPEQFPVPRGVVHNHGEPAAFIEGIFPDKLADAVDGRLVIEPGRLEYRQLPGVGPHETAVRHLVAPGKRLDPGLAASFVPATGDGGLDLEVDLVLIDRDQVRVVFYFRSFFWNTTRSLACS